jgi:hypothetical protein
MNYFCLKLDFGEMSVNHQGKIRYRKENKDMISKLNTTYLIL